MLPLTSSAVLVSIILSVVWHWNDLYEPTTFMVLIQVDEPILMSMRMYRLFIQKNTTYVNAVFVEDAEKEMKDSEQLRMFATFLSLLPILISYMFVQKYFMASVASTGIKG